MHSCINKVPGSAMSAIEGCLEDVVVAGKYFSLSVSSKYCISCCTVYEKLGLGLGLE